jgi:cysteine synthase
MRRRRNEPASPKRRRLLAVGAAAAMTVPWLSLRAAEQGDTEMSDAGKHESSAVGNTPLVRLNALPDSDGADVWVKWEGANPTGSMKDRMALGMIEAAEQAGDLKPGMRVVEATGGSTGAALAMVCAPRGYRVRFVTLDAIDEDKIRAMAALGAELEVLESHGRGITPELVQQGLDRVRELAAEPDTFWTNQFANEANAAGYRQMGREILAAGPVDAFVMAVGTGGCLGGNAQAFGEAGSETRVVAVEPAASRALSGGATGAHRIEGVGLGFVPETLQQDLIDEVEAVSDEEAFETTRALARHEGLFAGISSGANVAAAVRVARKLGRGKRVVTVLCDSGLRYLGGDLF